MSLSLEIAAPADLARLLDRRKSYSRIAVVAPGLDQELASAWQARLEREYRACGCETGLWFMLAAGASGIIFLIGISPSPAWSWTARIGTVFAFFVAGAVVGKLAGLVVARRRLARSADALALLLDSTAIPNQVPAQI